MRRAASYPATGVSSVPGTPAKPPAPQAGPASRDTANDNPYGQGDVLGAARALTLLVLLLVLVLSACSDTLPTEPTFELQVAGAVVDGAADTCIPPPSDLAAWLPGDGNAQDLAMSNHGALEGDAGFASGLVAESFQFDGVGDQVRLGNDPSLHVSGGDFTVMAWVRFDALSHNPGDVAPGVPLGDMSIVDKMSAAGASPNQDGWRLLKQNDNRIWFCLGGGCAWNAAQTLLSQTFMVPGVWYHVAVTKTAANFTLYVNGVAERTRSLPVFTDTGTADVLLGGNAREGAFLHGAVDEAQIVARAMSADEIADVSASDAAGTCKPSPEPDPEPDPDPDPDPDPEPSPVVIEAMARGTLTCRGKSKGVTPVTLLTSEGFDASSVRAESLRFGATGTEAPEAHGKLHLDDVDGDGDIDAVLHFRGIDTGVVCGATEALLTGVDGTDTPFSVVVVVRTGK